MIAYSYKRIIFGLLLMVLSLFVVACGATPEVQIPVPEVDNGGGTTPEAEIPTPEVDNGGDVSTPEAEIPTPEVDTGGDVSTPEAEIATPEVDTGEGATPVTEGGSTYYIDELLINVMESFPVQVSATVRGNLANGCIGFEGITPTREGNTFVLDVNTSHNGADGCVQMLLPFEENVSLDVEGLPAGEYTVKVEETMKTFTLEVDNTAAENNESGVVLTLERTACFGTCPIYEVKVYADGRIEYEGRDFVDVTGSQSSNMEADKVSELVNQFVEAGYLEWNDTYTEYYVTDMPTMITSVTVDGQTKRIERYAGDESAPLELIKLENLIDKAVNSVQWTGKEPMEPEPEPVGLANPASEYCVEQGGILAIMRDENGAQFGMCTFPDGSECEEWALFRGECAAGDSLESEGEPSEGESVTLDGTQWLFSWGEVEGTQFAPFADQPITLNFSADEINGNGSCNGFFGGYTIEGDSLTIGQTGTTRMACEEELMKLERQFFEALQSVEAFSYNTDSLTLSLPNGSLHFSANMPVEKTIFIGAEQVDCQGVAPQKCYLIKDDLNAEWEFFYDEIVGFEWQAGTEYELRVRITPVENPPADASSVVYELIEIVDDSLGSSGEPPEGTGEPSEGGSVTLDGTQWLFSWGEVEGEKLFPFADQPITLNFGPDEINGNGSCNGFFGGYTIEGDSLTIGEMGATAMACEEQLMELERQFFEALQSANAFTHNSDSLTLSLPNGTLHFTANMPVEKTIFIGAEQVDCQGVAPQKCYLVKEDLNAEWQYFYGEIVGFEWQAGAEYELRVRITPVENPPADAPSVMYELLDIVNEVPVE